jgi:hypothetical protein
MGGARVVVRTLRLGSRRGGGASEKHRDPPAVLEGGVEAGVVENEM